ncbi:hypothetical protein [Streptomyces sp. NBC_01361]|uniref:hypothetical protein n=1 Tax=Streptomyces sp. NBC_01361 TaxID=2903838 RepID=UPI002E372CD2|nr:hypothetical protein [Streptomyces sp. NBC_01361]
MKDAASPFGSRPGSPVVDPDLPAHLRKFLHEASPRDLERFGDPAGKEESAWWDVVPYLVRSGLLLGLGTVLWVVLGQTSDSTGSADPASNVGAFHYLFSRAADWLGRLLVPAAGLAVLWTALNVMKTRDAEQPWRKAHSVRNRYVLPSQLTQEAAKLLNRARTAAAQILDSEVHKRDLVDRRRAQLQLPAQIWEMACSLDRYSRLVKETPDSAEGEHAKQPLKARRVALKSGLAALQGHVEAIETYAVQTAEADARLRELQQVEQLEKDGEDVLDFLASTARAEVASAEVRQLSGQAAIVADRFTAALIAAKDAAVQALPAAPVALDKAPHPGAGA